MRTLRILTILFLLASCGSRTPFDRGRSSAAPIVGSIPSRTGEANLSQSFYETNIASIVEKNCTPCHANPAPDFVSIKKLVEVGKPNESALIARALGKVAGHPEVLAADSPEIAIITNWISGDIHMQNLGPNE